MFFVFLAFVVIAAAIYALTRSSDKSVTTNTGDAGKPSVTSASTTNQGSQSVSATGTGNINVNASNSVSGSTSASQSSVT